MSVDAAPAVPAWGAKSPWGKCVKSSNEPAAKPMSLAEVMQDEQVQSDWVKSARLAEELQAAEYGVTEALPDNTQNDATVDSVPESVQEAVVPLPAEGNEVQPSEEASDLEIAMMLQAQFDDEYEQEVSDREFQANKQLGNKVSLSLDLYRLCGKQSREPAEMEDGYSDDDYEDDIGGEYLAYDKQHRVMRKHNGDIVTKHNADVCGARNGKKLMESLPLSFPSGDIHSQKAQGQIKMSNKVYNQCMTYAFKSEKRRSRTNEQKDTSTSDLVLDTKTRLLLFRMVNANILDSVNGAISTGKEAVVFHASRHVDPDDMTSEVQEVAIKVFKTTLTEFKQRQQFLHGDRRYEDRVGRQSARKLVKLWAEKESANLERVARAGLPCPHVVIQHKHVLVMSFIGTDGVAAPKLKDAVLKPKALASCLVQVREALATLYHKCRLVHADLSEYNLLYHDKKVYIIDVGQSVETSHPRADEFLYRDCVVICQYFNKAGADGTPTAHELFCEVTGREIDSVDALQFKDRINCSRQAPKRRLQVTETYHLGLCHLNAKSDPGPLFCDPFTGNTGNVRSTSIVDPAREGNDLGHECDLEAIAPDADVGEGPDVGTPASAEGCGVGVDLETAEEALSSDDDDDTDALRQLIKPHAS
eukprot:m.379131 g.379131  ORF g.379131 m.379131 type:complete len:645 (+) comp20946_c0_seq1:164-2098(+)